MMMIEQTLSLGLRSGVLYPLGPSPSLLPDRFHLGGPTSVRMFRPNAMGPKDGGRLSDLYLLSQYMQFPLIILLTSSILISDAGDFMGGDLHWAAGLSILAPIPKRPDWPLKMHLFLNAGRLTRIDKCTCRLLPLSAKDALQHD